MKIIFIDEDDDQRETFSLTLQECFEGCGHELEVVGLAPMPELHEMQFLAFQEDIVSVVLDEQLKESGVAQYFGIELATYLRTLNKKLPIYILTSYPDSEELLEGEFTVEDILNKQDLPTRKKIVGARMLRRVDSYLDILDARETRFESLLRKSIEEELVGEDEEEFRRLRYLRSAPFEVGEIVARDKLDKIEDIENQLRALEVALSKNI